MIELSLRTSQHSEMVDISGLVEEKVRKSGIREGMVTVFVPHTTAGVTINENADPSVRSDIQGSLSHLIPPGAGYAHLEGNADSHIKASLMGSSVTVIVEGGKLRLGTWQGIFFCEFDGPRSRRVWLYFL